MRVQVRSLALRVFQASEPRGAEPFREQLAQAIELGLLPLAPGEEQVRQRIASLFSHRAEAFGDAEVPAPLGEIFPAYMERVERALGITRGK